MKDRFEQFAKDAIKRTGAWLKAQNYFLQISELTSANMDMLMAVNWHECIFINLKINL